MAAVPFTSLFLGDGGPSEKPIHTLLTSSTHDKSKCVAITCSRSCIHTTMWGPLIIDDQPSGDVPQSLLLTKPRFYNPHSHRQHLRPLYSQALVHELQAVTGVEVHRAHLLCDRQSRRCWWPCWPDHTLVRVKQIANMCGALPVGKPFIMNSRRHFENYWDIFVGLSLYSQLASSHQAAKSLLAPQFQIGCIGSSELGLGQFLGTLLTPLPFVHWKH